MKFSLPAWLGLFLFPAFATADSIRSVELFYCGADASQSDMAVVMGRINTFEDGTQTGSMNVRLFDATGRVYLNQANVEIRRGEISGNHVNRMLSVRAIDAQFSFSLQGEGDQMRRVLVVSAAGDKQFRGRCWRHGVERSGDMAESLYESLRLVEESHTRTYQRPGDAARTSQTYNLKVDVGSAVQCSEILSNVPGVAHDYSCHILAP